MSTFAAHLWCTFLQNHFFFSSLFQFLWISLLLFVLLFCFWFLSDSVAQMCILIIICIWNIVSLLLLYGFLTGFHQCCFGTKCEFCAMISVSPSGQWAGRLFRNRNIASCWDTAKCNYFQNVKDGSPYSDLPIHTNFGNLDWISRSWQCQKDETVSMIVEWYMHKITQTMLFLILVFILWLNFFLCQATVTLHQGQYHRNEYE